VDKTSKIFGSILLVVFLMWLSVMGSMIYESCEYQAGFSSYVERAAYGNSYETVAPSLDAAIAYLENNDLTEGFTSVLYKTADEDLAWYYQNLKEIRADLDRAGPDGFYLPAEKDLLFLNLKTRLLRSSGNVAAPIGISRFPHNTAYCILLWISTILLLGFFFCWVISMDSY